MLTKTWLPLFPGFYGTTLEPDEIKEEESLENLNSEREVNGIPRIDARDSDTFPVEMIDFDYQKFMYEVSEQFSENLEFELKDEGVLEKITYEKLRSPREYNFTNDSVNVEIIFNQENIENIKLFIENHYEQWKQYLKDRYTSMPGFIPFYSNDPNDWPIEESLQHEHKAGSILDFICQVLELEPLDMLEGEHIELEIINFNSLIDPDNIEAYPKDFHKISCKICGMIPEGHEKRHAYVLSSKGESYICPDCEANRGKYLFNRENKLVEL
jgi:hypothetical protein